MTPREEAIIDCKYGLNLGRGILAQHIEVWLHQNEDDLMGTLDAEYREAIKEIAAKLNTPECLLKDSK